METTNPNHGVAVEKGVKRYTGGCHCGAVRFAVELDLAEGAARCNCSVCMKTAVTGRIVKPSAFTLLSDEAGLGVYEWGASISKRFFCPRCGVHCFGRGYLEEVGGDYASVNVNCFDDVDPWQLSIIYWDGRHNNWDAGPRPAPWPI